MQPVTIMLEIDKRYVYISEFFRAHFFIKCFIDSLTEMVVTKKKKKLEKSSNVIIGVGWNNRGRG